MPRSCGRRCHERRARHDRPGSPDARRAAQRGRPRHPSRARRGDRELGCSDGRARPASRRRRPPRCACSRSSSPARSTARRCDDLIAERIVDCDDRHRPRRRRSRDRELPGARRPGRILDRHSSVRCRTSWSSSSIPSEIARTITVPRPAQADPQVAAPAGTRPDQRATGRELPHDGEVLRGRRSGRRRSRRRPSAPVRRRPAARGPGEDGLSGQRPVQRRARGRGRRHRRCAGGRGGAGPGPARSRARRCRDCCSSGVRRGYCR